jgi:hypothetical protein
VNVVMALSLTVLIHCVGLVWFGFSALGCWLLGCCGYKTFNACITTLEIVRGSGSRLDVPLRHEKWESCRIDGIVIVNCLLPVSVVDMRIGGAVIVGSSIQVRQELTRLKTISG